VDNIRQPLARLTETEAYERAEALRQYGHFMYGKGCGMGSAHAFQPVKQSFIKDWQKMFSREGQGTID